MNFQPLKDFLDFYLPMLGVPGSDTVIYRNHEEIFRYSSGYDNIDLRTPVRQDALYNVYSCTKLVTAVAITQLIERGELLPTDPLFAYIPEFKNTEVALFDTEGRQIGCEALRKPILIKHLLTMTSGMNYDINIPAIKDTVLRTGGKAPTLDICRALASAPLDFQPGEKFKYGLSFDVLGGVVEVISGMRFSEYVKQNIFEPLGMSESAFHYTDEIKSRLAVQYDYDALSGMAKIIPSTAVSLRFGEEYDSAGAGIISSVSDFILLADALAMGGVGKNGNRILSKFGVNLLRANALSEEQMKSFAFSRSMGYGYGYGVRTCMNALPYGNIAPVGEFGWDGAKLSLVSVSPETGISMFHAEHMGGVHDFVIPRLRNLLYSCIGE